MKANELRIGNLIYWNIPQKINIPHEVVGIVRGHPQTVPISLGDSMDDYKPIPLTEEWLSEFEFDDDRDKMFLGKTYKRYHIGRIRIWSIDGISFIVSINDQDLCEIKYVHQLQNIFLSLTGEELIPKS